MTRLNYQYSDCGQTEYWDMVLIKTNGEINNCEVIVAIIIHSTYHYHYNYCGDFITITSKG